MFGYVRFFSVENVSSNRHTNFWGLLCHVQLHHFLESFASCCPGHKNCAMMFALLPVFVLCWRCTGANRGASTHVYKKVQCILMIEM